MLDLSTLDPTASLVDAEEPKANAKILADKFNLHQKVVFLEEEKTRVQAYLSRQIKKCNDDRENALAKRVRNIEAYEGLADKGETITLPFARQQANQQHAWLMDRIFSADPYVSVLPLGDGSFHISVPDPDTGIVEDKKVTYSAMADDIEALLQFKWEHRLPVRRVVSDWVMEGLQDGTFPSVLKTLHDEQKVRIANRMLPHFDADEMGVVRENAQGQRIQIVNAPEFNTVVASESVQVASVPGDDFLVPFGHTNIQRAPWIGMRMEPDTSTVRVNISSGRWDFCKDIGEEPTDEEIDRVLYSAEDTSADSSKRRKRATERVDKRKEIDPSKTHPIVETYFRWPIMLEDDPNTITWMECVGDYHVKTETLLSCWLLDTWNGKRPFVDWFMRQRPNSYSGTCTVEDVAPFQRYASNLFHLQMTNMVMRNVSVIMVRKGTSTATFLKNRQNIRPGMVLQVDEMEDVSLKPLGTPIESIASEITFLKQGATEMGLSTQYDTATADLSRVTSGAFAQQQDLSKMQPKEIYKGLAEKIGELALMYVQTLCQYAPEQVIPSFGKDSDAVISRAIHLPREMVTDQFAFALKATTSDQTPEAMFQQDLMLGQQVDKANQFAMAVCGQIMLPGTPPEFQRMGVFWITRSELMLASQFKNARRHDASQFAMTPEMISAAIASLQAREQMMAKQGGANGSVPNAGPGGSVPPGASGPEGMGSVQQQPGGQGMGPPPQGGVLPS